MSPALLAAMATIVPTVRTPARAAPSVQPAAANTVAVPRRVTRVIPDVGCEETPTMPTMRAATATKRTPKTPTPAESTARWSGAMFPAKTPGTTPATSTTRPMPPTTNHGGRSRSVRGTGPSAADVPARLIPRATAVKAPHMVGSPRATVRSPAVATAPAPM